jgi:pSer/pThr/pTyr-binding forkhead associated (FHA) protein
MLSRRLRKAREAKEQATQAISGESIRPSDHLQPASSPTPPSVESPSGEVRPDTIGALDARLEASALGQQFAPVRSTSCWLTTGVGGRHIALPNSGELVLGRFDPNFGLPPDIDLTYEDRDTRTVSRRHAKIIGVNGRYTIEDMGSRHGVLLNREPVKAGPSRQLRPGDRIALGDTQLLYDTVPAYLLDIPQTTYVRHFLIVTPTGRKLTIVPPKDIVIGRSDRYIDFTPDIDLSPDGDVAIRVSRRHAIITWRNRSPYLEDLGSGFGTRYNGETLLLGRAVLLKPGDHIWVGGCVLAYDVEF